ncbi:hypothetical protein [Haloarchaeobius baliensis]|uniref:hypothetical protein n=1 Tax=Haloarchaeobius baliensis TaxID=1670458 RepID=UPI003F8819B3
MGRLGQSSLSKWIDRRRLDRTLALFGLVFALALLPMRTLVSHIYATTLPVVLGLASLLYLLSTRGESYDSYPLPTFSTVGARLLELVVLLSVSLLFVLGGLLGQRTILFLNVAGATGTVLLFQLLFVDEADLRPGVLLVELLAFAFAVRFVGLYSVAGYIGIDVWTHMSFVNGIRVQNSLVAMESKYIAAPLYHLLVAVVTDVSGLAPRNALYLSVGVALTLSGAMVYYGARQFIEPRWALFAMGLWLMSSQVIRWGLHVIPTSLGIAFFVPLMAYLVRFLEEYRPRDVGMLSLFVVAITLTHQVSAFVVIVVLGLAFAVQVMMPLLPIETGDEPTSVRGILGFSVGFVALDWSLTPYSGGSFVQVMLDRLRTTIFQEVGLLQVSSSKNVASTAGDAGTSMLVKLIAYINVYGFLVLLLLTGIGALCVLKYGHRTHGRLLDVGLVSVMSVFVMALPILGVSLFLPGRWYAFMYVPMVFLGVFGLRHLVGHLDRRLVVVGLLLLVVSYPSIMLVSGAATLDSPVFESKQQRYAFTESEVDGARSVGNMIGGRLPPVYTDAPYTAVFRRTDSHLAGLVDVPRDSRASHGLVVYRGYQTEGAPLVGGVNNSTKLSQVSKDRICSPSRSRLYTNGNVLLCSDGDVA